MAQPHTHLFPILLALLGLFLTGLGLYRNFLGGSENFILFLGLGYIATGTFLYLENPAAVTMYAIMLAAVWAWSLGTFQSEPLKLFYNVGMPTVIGFYIFSSRLDTRLEPEQKLPSINDQSTERSSGHADGLYPAILAKFSFAPRVLGWIALLFAAEESLSIFLHVADNWSSFEITLSGIWILSPIVALFHASLGGEESLLRDSGICLASMMLAAFGMAGYDINISLNPMDNSGGIFLWIPLAQWIWVGGWIFLIEHLTLNQKQ